MSPINLAIIGLRLLSIYCLVGAVPLFSTFGLIALFTPESYGHAQPAAIFSALLPGGLLLILSILLFFFSEPLARRIASTTSPEPDGSLCTFEQVQAIAFAAAGVLIFANSLPSAGRALQGLMEMHAVQKQGGDIPPHQIYSSWLYCIGVIAQLVVGLLLLLKPKGFRNVWRYLQTAGT